jgi:hypothetical protein
MAGFSLLNDYVITTNTQLSPSSPLRRPCDIPRTPPEMAHLDPGAPGLPVSDKVLRDLAKNAAKILPNFAEKEPATGVK